MTNFLSLPFFARCLARWFVASVAVSLVGCATPPAPYDYTAYKQAKPASMLVLPPLNESPEVIAPYGVLSQVTMPLSEAGYYVIPVGLMDETFKQNGIANPAETHEVPAEKLREIFGADAVVLINIKRYGTSYAVITSETTVAVEARIVDLRTQQLLWQGGAQASSKEGEGGSGGLVELLIKAVVQQIIGTATDASYKYAGQASARLLMPRTNGLLFGPRSPGYQKD